MDETPPSGNHNGDQLRSQSTDAGIKAENNVDSPRFSGVDTVSTSVKPSPTPRLSTEPSDAGSAMATSTGQAKKRGIATAVKKTPKRPRPDGGKKPKRPKSQTTTPGPDDVSGDEESDNGPYCLCRGPDDHRWMICCENCEDWFHGECIKMNKEIGENLIEKFICPNCSTGDLCTIYKKTCALGACKKAARLTQSQPSVFCSNEHAQTWWERMVSRLPKAKGKSGLNDLLAQDEFMALLNSGIGGGEADGMWKLAKTPFSDASMDSNGDDVQAQVFGDEERLFLENTAKIRAQLTEETVLCHKMFTLIELAQERRRAAINLGRFGDDICGYDSRLDAVSARDVFAAYMKSSEGESVFQTSKLGDPLGEDDPVRGMCERKRCKAHGGWQKMLPLGIKHQIKEMAAEAAEVEEEEKMVRRAASERRKRRQAESNWVEVLDS